MNKDKLNALQTNVGRIHIRPKVASVEFYIAQAHLGERCSISTREARELARIINQMADTADREADKQFAVPSRPPPLPEKLPPRERTRSTAPAPRVRTRG